MSKTSIRARRGGVIAVIAAVIVILGAVVYAWLAPTPTGAEDQLRQVTTTIRCPVCIGESIADSTAPISVAMRDEAQAQLEEGATPQEVREFFAEAYGPDVLLMPALSGSGAVVWAVPVAIAIALLVLIATGGVAWWRQRSREQAGLRGPALVTASALVLTVVIAVALALGAPTNDNSNTADADVAATAALALAVEKQPGDVDIRLAYGTALKATGQEAKAHSQFAAAYRLDPLDADIAYLYASALLIEGELDDAAVTLDRLLDHSPEHSAALLMRGIMLRQAGDERADELLMRFLETSPDDPAADAVRDMVRSE